MLFKIALSGMKGRKKDSFLLGFVIFLSVFFIILATILHTSSEAAKVQERRASFGPWQHGIFEATDSEADQLKALPSLEAMGKSYFLGHTPDIGYIGSYNEAFNKITNIQMVQGRMPLQKNEIAIEHQKLATYPYEVKIGDTITVPITIKLHTVPINETLVDQALRMKEEFIQVSSEVEAFIEKESYEAALEKYGEYFVNRTYDSDDFNNTLGNYERYIQTIKEESNDPEAQENFRELSRMMNSERNRRYILDTEYADGFTINLKTYYDYYFARNLSWALSLSKGIDETLSNDELIMRDGVLTDIELIFTYKLTVTGFYDNHSQHWDIGDHIVPTGYVQQDLYDEVYQYAFNNDIVNLEEFLPLEHSNFSKSNIFIQSKLNPWKFNKRYTDDFESLRTNSFTYPKEGVASEATIAYAILFMIFVATVVSVFQINLAQIKRRSRKITLLKSIGMVNSQMLKLLIFELLILVVIVFPLGILSGLVAARGLVYLLNQFSQVPFLFTIEWTIIGIGLLICLFSVIIGSSFPAFRALKTPLVGAMNKAPKHKKKQLSHLNKVHRVKKQSFIRISWSYLWYEKRKNLITLSLYCMGITLLLSTMFLAFLGFDRYKDEVIAVDRPDYGYEFIRGLSDIEVLEISRALDELEPVSHYQFIKYATGVYLQQGSMNSHPIFDDYFNNKEFVSLDTHDEATAEFKNTSIETNIYAISPESYAWDSLVADMPSFDMDKFMEGEGLLVLLPQYDQDSIADMSYDYRDRHKMVSDYDVEIGDTLTFGFTQEPVAQVVLSDEMGKINLNYKTFDILSIGHHTLEIGVWPFSSTLEHPIIITSIENFDKLYPRSKYRSRMDIRQFKTLIETQFPTSYGRSSFYIYNQPGMDSPSYQIELQRLGLEYQTPMINYSLEKERIFNQSLKLATIIVTLGLSIALIILMILLNTSQSKVEQERTRIGVLQALGVTKRQFKRLYIFTGLSFGLIALLFAHIVFVGLISIFASIEGGHFMTAVESLMWLYPTKVHIGVSIIYLILATFTYYSPLRPILKNQAIYNIQNNQR